MRFRGPKALDDRVESQFSIPAQPNWKHALSDFHEVSRAEGPR
jgi:hypothetical protein